jgi:hypothetical protein
MYARMTRAPSGIRANLMAGLAVHAVAAVLFAILAMAKLDGCDRADSLAGALGYAVIADLVLATVLVTTALWRTRGDRSAVLAGWGLSFVPAIVLAGALLAYINTIPSGCPL